MAFRFESLEIWHRARAYASQVYSITEKFPRKEDFGLTSQMNRAVNSISLNIAEGTGRQAKGALIQHLGIAVGSLFEVVGGSFLALDRRYITQIQHEILYSHGEQLAKSINAFRNSIK